MPCSDHSTMPVGLGRTMTNAIDGKTERLKGDVMKTHDKGANNRIRGPDDWR